MQFPVALNLPNNKRIEAYATSSFMFYNSARIIYFERVLTPIDIITEKIKIICDDLESANLLKKSGYKNIFIK